MNKHRDRKGVQYVADDHGIRAYLPRSIAWNKCREATYKPILQKMIDYIEDTIGVPIKQLKREHRNEV